MTGTARANFAPTVEAPQRTQSGGWAAKHRRETVRGFHNLGFNIILSLLAVFIIHANFSYPTSPSLLPDPFFRVRVADIHKAKHGSDTGAYDNEGRFLPQKYVHLFHLRLFLINRFDAGLKTSSPSMPLMEKV